jgi:hypothetical protein
VVGAPEYKSWSSTQSFQEEKLHLENIKSEWLISNFLKYVTHQCHKLLRLYTSGNRWMNEYGALVELFWQVKPKYSNKNQSQYHSVYHKSYKDCPRIKPRPVHQTPGD